MVLAKFGRLYRITKLIRLIKLLKLAKDHEKVTSILTETVKIQKGLERLIIFVGTLVLVGHLVACIWVFQAKFIILTQRDNWIRDQQLDDSDNWDLYIASYYFTVTTITTVGYGDITAT
jgi:hypothetical protein